MGFSLKCPMPKCSYQTTADTKDELMKQVLEHARAAHNLDTVPPDVLTKVDAAIKPVP